MIPQEIIETNAAKFFKVGVKYGFINDSLIDSLGVEFVSKHGIKSFNYEGGLIDFALKVTDHAIKLNDVLPEDKRADKTELIRFIFISTMAESLIEFNEAKTLLFMVKNGMEINDTEYQLFNFVITYEGKTPILYTLIQQAKETIYSIYG